MNINMKKTLQMLVLASTAISANTSFAVVSGTPVSNVILIESGWKLDTETVVLNTALINPAGCSVTNFGYVTGTTDPGRKLFQQQIEDAFLRGIPVRLLISDTPGDCPFGKPHILGVRMCSNPATC